MKIIEIKKKGILDPHPIEKKGTDGYNNKTSGYSFTTLFKWLKFRFICD